MAMIPQVDLNVTLNDMGYKIPIVSPGAGQYALGEFGLVVLFNPFADGIGAVTCGNVAQAPSYGVGFGIPPTDTNYQLSTSLTGFSFVTSGPNNVRAVMDIPSGTVLCINYDNIFTAGTLDAKTQAWPGALDYSIAGMVPLVIANADTNFSFVSQFPVILDDLSTAFCVSAFNNGAGVFTAPGFYFLLIKPDLTTSGWLPDQWRPMFGVLAPAATFTFPKSGLNYQFDLGQLPTVTAYTVAFNFATGETITQIGTGDVSTDASNAFGGFTGATPPTPYFTAAGIFAFDNASGNNTGCWYCSLDCSAFGQVIFTMPDASLGPSSSPTVWQNFNFAGFNYEPAWFPQTDLSGNWWWIRLPLCDGAGNMIVEPLTSEVYSELSAAQSGRFYGTHVAFAGGAAAAGGTK